MPVKPAPAGRDDSLFRKVVNVEALPFDERGRLLIVQPMNSEGWALVGGATQRHESPAAALARLGARQIGLALQPAHLLVTDHEVSATHEVQHILMATRPLSQLELASLRSAPGEIEQHMLVNRTQAAAMLAPPVLARVSAAWTVLAGKRDYGYLENGRPVLLPMPVLL